MTSEIKHESTEQQLSVDDFVLRSRIFKANMMDPPTELLRAQVLAQNYPAVIKKLIESQTDGLHGATSYSFESVAKHGLVPTGLFMELGITALGLEHQSQPTLRKSIHVVPWTRAGETIRYAELRTNPKSAHDYVTPQNAQLLAALPLETYEGLAPGSTAREHMVGVINEARQYVASEHTARNIEFFPVVYGINSDVLPGSVDIKPVESLVRCDTELTGKVPASAISSIYVPEDYMAATQEEYGAWFPGVPIESLESLRQIDTDTYGYLLPT